MEHIALAHIDNFVAITSVIEQLIGVHYSQLLREVFIFFTLVLECCFWRNLELFLWRFFL
jgi:hypothetical protein